jgi:hypothetical protein
MAERLMGTEPRFLAMVLRWFGSRDLLEIKRRMIGSGKIGGKSAGMTAARRIVEASLPEVARRLEPHDSFYIGTDVFYTYLVHNRLWKLRVRQRTPEGYYEAAPALKEGLLGGTFPDSLREQFLRALEYYGQSPIIVRSSSLLEDSFGHAFAGKYESVFCVNGGSPEDRLLAFENALRSVYASTMDESALAYRSSRGLTELDEQMAILVQRVSGSLFGSLFMPALAGVGYSFNSWKWHRDIDPSAGMLRLVAGLGTRAVDRTGGDYPRLVSLDKPSLDPSGSADRSRYCQRSMDVLNLETNRLEVRPLEEAANSMPPWLLSLLCERDTAAERYLGERGESRRVLIGTCSGAVERGDLLADFGSILRTVQEAYGSPVDLEFTVNWSEDGDYRINLLQCRPLQSYSESRGPGPLDSPVFLSEKSIAFDLDRDFMGPGTRISLQGIVAVDPQAYYDLPWRDKPTVARVVGSLNTLFGSIGRNVILLAPGRLGTSSPELGLPVRFAEIDQFRALCEVEYSEAGYRPELSFGSHFFQDLVESGICYAALPEEEGNRARLFLSELKDTFREFLPLAEIPDGVVRVYACDTLVFMCDPGGNRCFCGSIKLDASLAMNGLRG